MSSSRPGATVVKNGRSLAEAITNPTVIVEVLSDATERYDRDGKFKSYQTLASLREYVLTVRYSTTVQLPPQGRSTGRGVPEEPSWSLCLPQAVRRPCSLASPMTRPSRKTRWPFDDAEKTSTVSCSPTSSMAPSWYNTGGTATAALGGGGAAAAAAGGGGAASFFGPRPNTTLLRSSTSGFISATLISATLPSANTIVRTSASVEANARGCAAAGGKLGYIEPIDVGARLSNALPAGPVAGAWSSRRDVGASAG
ncbi:MAG: Uma2 family endonuclease [Labilithrix sp.]|nr:Uma2 family endonuclease [Labilithrix sp.]MCW5812396.1 Uma2 family endonuclease [Labilithrix sp.]